MKESTLLKVALACSLAGLALLYIVSSNIEFKDYEPIKLDSSLGEDVKLLGTITKITQKDDVAIIEVEHQNVITIILFTDDKNLILAKGDNVEVLGQVQEYKGKNEIIAQKLRLIRIFKHGIFMKQQCCWKYCLQ